MANLSQMNDASGPYAFPFIPFVKLVHQAV